MRFIKRNDQYVAGEGEAANNYIYKMSDKCLSQDEGKALQIYRSGTQEVSFAVIIVSWFHFHLHLISSPRPPLTLILPQVIDHKDEEPGVEDKDRPG